MNHVNAEAHDNSKTLLGFWLYLMTDLVLFASLFATYAVLYKNTAGGPSGAEIFDLPFVLIETLLLLTSSFTCGLMLLAARRQDTARIVRWMAVTGLLGVAFVGMELYEFNHLIHEGFTWQTSAFLSAFFTLVGTHGLHICIGLLWLAVLLVRIVRGGFTAHIGRKLQLFSLFWHFLDIVWIFIFTVVYLMGVQS